MDFTFNEAQTQLRSTVSGFLRRENDFATRTAALRTRDGWRRDFWERMATDIGILGATIPTRCGGSGGDRVDQMIILDETGYNLLIEPYLETAVIATELLSASEHDDALKHIAEGKTIWSFAWAESCGRYCSTPRETSVQRDGKGWRLNGVKHVVIAAPWADRLIVTAVLDEGVGLCVVDPGSDGVHMVRYATIDGRCAADIDFVDVWLDDDALLFTPAEGGKILDSIMDVGTAGLGAEALGVLRRLLDDTVRYTSQRQQFGQPISHFQIVQHRLVDMHLHLEMATSAVYNAVLSLDSEPQHRMRAVSAMKVTVGQACRFIGQNAVQLHGGMGMTNDLPISHAFRRAIAIDQEFGDVEYHLQRVIELGRIQSCK